MPSVSVTVMLPAPNTVLVKAAVLARSRSANVPALSKATGSIEVAAPVLAFSVTVGLVAVWVSVGASFCGLTVVDSVFVADQVLVWSASVALMLLLVTSTWAVSATRTVNAPGLPL